MDLFETIDIRLFKLQDAEQIQNIFKLICGNNTKTMNLAAALLLRSCNVPGDWAFQLSWPKNSLPQAKTALGRQLAESMRGVGMVHHSLAQVFSTATFKCNP